MNLLVSEYPRSPYLLEQIEKLMLFIAQVEDIELLKRRRIPKAFGLKLRRQPFIDLCTLADFRETLMRDQPLSMEYVTNSRDIVDSIERTMPPQYHTIEQQSPANVAV